MGDVKDYKVIGHGLKGGQSLKEQEAISSPNGCYYAVVQKDGNFVLYMTGQFHHKNCLWSSRTNGKGKGPGFHVTMQGDGNLVRYDGFNNHHWSTETNSKGVPGAYLVLQDDGNLVVYDGAAQAIWGAGTDRAEEAVLKPELKSPPSEIAPGQTIEEGKYLRSHNGYYYAVVEPDGNFVLYASAHWHTKNALWSSKSGGKGKGPGFQIALQEDGNLVRYDGYHNHHWSTDTNGKGSPGRRLVLQDDGNLVLYDGAKKALWATGTDRGK